MQKLKALKESSVQITGKLPTSAKSSMPFGEWMDLWYQNYSKPRIKATTQEGYEASIYTHIIPSIGHIPLDKLTQNDLQQFYTRLKKSGRSRYIDTLGAELSDRTVRGCHARCRMALEKAVSEGLIFKNPALGCKLPPKKSREMQILEADELRRFLTQAQYNGFYEIFMLDVATGMRRGELLALQWDDVNLQTGELKIKRQVTRTKGMLLVSETKTKASERVIVLPPSVVSMLSEYRTKVDSRWIFPSPVKEDAPRDPQTVYKRMQEILVRAGCKRVRFHDIRHTFATMALAKGMDVKTLSSTIGHVSAATTLDIYSHVTSDMQRNSADKIESHMGRKEPLPVHLRKYEEVPKKEPKPPQREKFEPYKGKIRRSGSGGLYQVNENLWEGNYSPTHADGKRHKHNVYAKTREECEVLLEAMIIRVKAEIEEERQQIKIQEM